MNKILLTIIIASFSLFASTSILPDYINSDTTFGDTVIVKNRTFIDNHAELRFLEGSTILGDTIGTIICTLGTVIADGSYDKPIKMYPLNPDKNWGGISIGDSTEGSISRFSYVEISKANYGLFIVDGSKVVVNNCVIHKNIKDGIFLADSDLIIDSSSIKDHATYSGITSYGRAESPCSLTVTNCQISDNSTTGFGGGLNINNTYFTLSKSIVEHNSAKTGAGISIFGLDAKIENSVIRSNNATLEGGGIYATMDTPIQIINTQIVNNSADSVGGALNTFGCPTIIENCNFSNNSAKIGGAIHTILSYTSINRSIFFENESNTGAALYLIDDSLTMVNSLVVQNVGTAIIMNRISLTALAQINNCTIADNTSNAITVHPEYPLTVNNSIFWNNDSTSFLYNNMPTTYSNLYMEEENSNPPLFKNTSDLDYSLLEGSPCIDQGTEVVSNIFVDSIDLIGNKRIINNRIDIGAYEYMGPTSILKKHSMSTNIVNAFLKNRMLHVKGTFCNNLEYIIYKANGQKFQTGTVEIDNPTIALDDKITPGYYLLSLDNGTKIPTKISFLFIE